MSIFAPLVIGLDPVNIHALLQCIEAAMPNYLDAKAAIEMACVDVTARELGPAVHT